MLSSYRNPANVVFIVSILLQLSCSTTAKTVGCAGFGLLEGVEDEMDEESCREFVRRMGLPFLPRNGHFRDPRWTKERSEHEHRTHRTTHRTTFNVSHLNIYLLFTMLNGLHLSTANHRTTQYFGTKIGLTNLSRIHHSLHSVETASGMASMIM